MHATAVAGGLAVWPNEFDSDFDGLDAGAIPDQEIAKCDGACNFKFRCAIFVRILDPLF